MMEPAEQQEQLEGAVEGATAEPSSRIASIVRRAVLAVLAAAVILSMLSNLIGLPDTIDSPSRSDIGLTESEIIERYGQPDITSNVQVFEPTVYAGLGPRRLDAGELYYSLIYEEGPLNLVFHLVSPGTYFKHNGYRVDQTDWIVLERFIGTGRVLY